MTRKVLWVPSDERRDASTMQKYMNWLSSNHGLEFSNYEQLWRWSVSDLNFFGKLSGITSTSNQLVVLRELYRLKNAWCTMVLGASLNFLDEIFRHSETCPDRIAISSISETFGKETLTWNELGEENSFFVC